MDRTTIFHERAEDDQGLHEMAVGLLDAVPFASVLGISISRIRRGVAILSLEVRESSNRTMESSTVA